MLTKGELQQATTRWAQGGVAAVLGGDPDSTDLHLADTLAAGAGLCDVDAVRVLVDEGPARVHELIALGAIFDRDARRRAASWPARAATRLPRIVHAGGAATGAEIERALVDAVQRHRGRGARARLRPRPDRRGRPLPRRHRPLRPTAPAARCGPPTCCVTTGGAGQLFAVTTNPLEATGDGIAMALRAGVAVADVEFVQFHPTALHHPAMPRPLLSEALRGHGALLRDAEGRALRRRAAARATSVSRADHRPDARAGRRPRLARRHRPRAASTSGSRPSPPSCRAAGLDPATDWLPVAPAAHYSCGGIVTDLDGATSLPGPVGRGRGRLHRRPRRQPAGVELAARGHGVRAPGGRGHRPRASTARRPPAPCASRAAAAATSAGRPHRRPLARRRRPAIGATGTTLQRTMTADAGVLRSADVAGQARGGVRAAAVGDDRRRGSCATWPPSAGVLCAAALAREESRGAHTRSDFPEPAPPRSSPAGRLVASRP